MMKNYLITDFSDLNEELESLLSQEIAKIIDMEVIRGLNKFIFNGDIEERKINIRRRINLMRLIGERPNMFK